MILALLAVVALLLLIGALVSPRVPLWVSVLVLCLWALLASFPAAGLRVP